MFHMQTKGEFENRVNEKQNNDGFSVGCLFNQEHRILIILTL